MIVGNIAGLCSQSRGLKLGMIKELAIEENAQIISLTESHLSDDFHEAEVTIEGYNVFRKDRTNNRRRGGVITYLKSNLAITAQELTSGSIGLIEYQCIYIKKPNILLMNVYRSPDSTSNNFAEVLNALKETTNDLPQCPSILLTGDFNFPGIRWSHGEASNRQSELSTQGLFVNFINELFLTQLVDRPTRQRNILDLILTNNEELITEVDILADDEYLSDHRMIVAKTTLPSVETPSPNPPRNPESFRGLNFFHKDINWNNLNQEINDINWEDRFSNNSLDDNFSIFQRELFQIAQRHIPKKKTQNRNRQKIPDDRRALIRKRAKINKKKVRSRNQSQIARLEQILVGIGNAIRVSHENGKLAEEARAIACIKTNPKYFYYHARKNSKVKTQVGPFENEGEIIQDPYRKAETLREQFESVFTGPENSNPNPTNSVPRTESPLDDFPITEEDIVKQIKKMPLSAAAGPDEIPSTLLKNCVDSIKSPLRKIWQQSFEEGLIPDILKTGIITPIYKGGDRTKPQNYRPISLTSHITKIFEKIVREKITNYMTANEKFNDNQHGFRNGRSCVSQLLNHYDTILESLENETEVDVIYLDFAKAFDKVHHVTLLEKLQNIGITGKLHQWIKEFLRERKQYVTVEGATSRASEVLSGVPQGTVLGPLLFLIYISDIDEGITDSTISCFADDTRVLKSIKEDSDRACLQNDLNRIYNWADSNKMKFNEKKFESINYLPRRQNENTHNYTSQNGSPIETKTETRDLGIIMKDDATFSEHITAIAKKGKRQAGWALRIFKSRNTLVMLTLLKTLIQPLLEYGCEIWNPHLQMDITKLETIQRNFTKKIEGMDGMNYWERLHALKLNSLERRRERYMIIYTWKILNDLAPNIEGRNKIRAEDRLRRGVVCKDPYLHPRNSRFRTLKENSFVVKGPRLFNKLPNEIRENCLGISLDAFKSKVDKFLATIPDKPKLPGAGYSQQADTNSLLNQIR